MEGDLIRLDPQPETRVVSPIHQDMIVLFQTVGMQVSFSGAIPAECLSNYNLSLVGFFGRREGDGWGLCIC